MSTRKLALIGLVVILPLTGIPVQVKAQEQILDFSPISQPRVEEGSNVLVGDIAVAEQLYQEWLVDKAQKKQRVTSQSMRRQEVGGNKFAKGNCTYYVASIKNIPWNGNANQWIANSKVFGAIVNKIPEVGAILQTNESRRGHVAYIESVSGNTFTISEWNYAGLYVKTIRTFDISDPRIVGIIHY